MAELKVIESKLSSIDQSLRKVADHTINKSCVNIELTYSPKEIDRVLFAGSVDKDTFIKEVKGDTLINESVLDFLAQESLVVCFIKIDRAFKLTRRGYTLKYFGGFSELRKKENTRIRRQEILNICLALGGWVFSAFAAGFGAWVAYVLSKQLIPCP